MPSTGFAVTWCVLNMTPFVFALSFSSTCTSPFSSNSSSPRPCLTNSKWRATQAMMILVSRFASSEPVHLRGPRSYGLNALSGIFLPSSPSQRSGLKSFLLSPKILGCRWIVYARGVTHRPSMQSVPPSGRVRVVFDAAGATRAVVPGGWRRSVSLMRASV